MKKLKINKQKVAKLDNQVQIEPVLQQEGKLIPTSRCTQRCSLRCTLICTLKCPPKTFSANDGCPTFQITRRCDLKPNGRL